MKREEYLDDYQDHAERRPKKKKKKKKRKHRVYAFFVLLFAFLILVLGIFILFHVQKVEVKGNDYCSTEEIVKSVQNDKYSVNGLYVLAKYKLGYGKQPDCFESIKVSLKNPWTLKIIVQEKERIGYVMDSDGKYYYFDQDGMVVDVEEAPVDGIPLVDGHHPGHLLIVHSHNGRAHDCGQRNILHGIINNRQKAENRLHFNRIEVSGPGLGKRRDAFIHQHIYKHL